MQNVKGTTRFSDLHDDIQKEVLAIDNVIGKIISFKEEIDAFMPQHEADVNAVATDVALMERKYEAVRAVLDSDVQAIAHVQDLTKQDVDDAKISFRAVENLKLPAHYHTASLWGSRAPNAGGASGTSAGSAVGQLDATGQDIMAFYQRHVQSLDERYARIKERLAEVQQHMPGVEAGLYERVRSLSEAGVFPDDQAQQLIGALTETYQAIIGQANRVAECRQQFVDLQSSLLGALSGRLAHNGF